MTTWCRYSFYTRWTFSFTLNYMGLVRDVIVQNFQSTANCVRSMKLGTVVSFKIFVWNCGGVTILGPVIDDVRSVYGWNVFPGKEVILCTVWKQILCWFISAEQPYFENQWLLSYSRLNIIWRRWHSLEEFGKCQTYYFLHIIGKII